MSKCAACGSELPKGVMVCPQCKADQPRYVIYLPVEGRTQLIRCTGKCLAPEKMRKAVEGNIEAVPSVLGDDWAGEDGIEVVMVINANQNQIGLKRNVNATDLSMEFDDFIVGDALLLGATSREYIGFSRDAALHIIDRWQL